MLTLYCLDDENFDLLILSSIDIEAAHPRDCINPETASADVESATIIEDMQSRKRGMQPLKRPTEPTFTNE
jgi:hypothetical protein